MDLIERRAAQTISRALRLLRQELRSTHDRQFASYFFREHRNAVLSVVKRIHKAAKTGKLADGAATTLPGGR